MQGYWFSGDRLRDGWPIPPDGEWLIHYGPVVPCRSGLHASEHPYDALQYAPGPWLSHVDLEGSLMSHAERMGGDIDKHVGSRRRINARIDATDLLWRYARACALDVADLWGAPDIVREYLETGRDELREASVMAASSVARTATFQNDVVRFAAWATLYASACNTVWFAVRSAVNIAKSTGGDSIRLRQRSRLLDMVREGFAESGYIIK